MVFLRVIGSGSSGNCYLLDSGKEILIIEAGISFQNIKEAIDYQTSRIVGVLSSHEHGDHRKYLHEYEKAGIKCLKGNSMEHYGVVFHAPFYFGEFRVDPFDVVHDVPCFGYLIEHSQMGKLLFVTDAMYVKYRFVGINNIIVESNYAQDILDENTNSGVINEFLRKRIMNSHMSFDTAKAMVKANMNPMLKNVIMCHLSGHNSDKKRFTEEMQDLVGQFCNVTVARKGTEVELDLVPF